MSNEYKIPLPEFNTIAYEQQPMNVKHKMTHCITTTVTSAHLPNHPLSHEHFHITVIVTHDHPHF